MLPDGQSLEEVLHMRPEEALAWVKRHVDAIDCGEDWQTLTYGWSSRVATDSGKEKGTA